MGLVRYDQNDVIILRKDILVFQQFFHSSSFLTRYATLGRSLTSASYVFSAARNKSPTGDHSAGREGGSPIHRSFLSPSPPLYLPGSHLI